ncbi:MAG: flavodoxin domain-containing protein [Methanocella sp.]
MNALIVYGTRGGATKQIADEMAKVFEGQGFTTTVTDAKASRGIDVGPFDLVVVGSSVWANKWKRQATAFLKRNRKVLANKKVALFSSGMAGDDPAHREEANQRIVKVAGAFPEIRPLALAYFGGCISFDSPNFMARFMANMMKKDFEKKGIDTSKPVDHRDWDAIRKWAAAVAAHAKAK